MREVIQSRWPNNRLVPTAFCLLLSAYCFLPTCFLPTAFCSLLTARREDALQRDIKIESQVRHQVVVRLVASGWRDRFGCKCH